MRISDWSSDVCSSDLATASALFPPEKLNPMNDTNTRKTVRFNLDPNMPLSEEAKARLARLATMPDSEIDFSDISPSPADPEWTRPGVPPNAKKRQVPLRLEAEVLAIFRPAGRRSRPCRQTESGTETGQTK